MKAAKSDDGIATFQFAGLIETRRYLEPQIKYKKSLKSNLKQYK